MNKITQGLKGLNPNEERIEPDYGKARDRHQIGLDRTRDRIGPMH